MKQCLVVNSDMTPLSIIPLRRSMALDLYSDRVTALSYYAGSSIRSGSLSHRVPAVMMCVNYVNARMVKRPTKRNIRLRDGNKCAYCGIYLTNSIFSIDHVIPRSKGGQNTWENLVTCDRLLNSLKGDKSVKEAKLKLRYKPFRPSGSIFKFNYYNEEWHSFVANL